MKSAELDTIYLDLSAGINAARLTCEDDHAGISDLLKTQHALDAIASLVARVRAAAPDEQDYVVMFSELADTTTALRLVVLQRLNAIDHAA